MGKKANAAVDVDVDVAFVLGSFQVDKRGFPITQFLVWKVGVAFFSSGSP